MYMWRVIACALCVGFLLGVATSRAYYIGWFTPVIGDSHENSFLRHIIEQDLERMENPAGRFSVQIP